jgi:DASS family divalent anion:Na+ symporter
MQRSLAALAGIAAGLSIWALPPPGGVQPAAMHMRALLAWAAVFWAFDVLPDYVVGLGLIIGWIVLAVVTFALGFGATLLLLPPEAQPTISRGLIGTQIQALGSPSWAELINGAVLIAAVLGWISAPYHHIDVAWVAVGGMTLLLGANLLDRTTFRAGIQWDFIFFLGAVLSLTEVARHLGIDAWIIHALAPVLEPLAPRPTHFLLVVALAVFAARFVLPSLPLVSLLIVTIVPIAAHAHISPLALTLVICTTVSVWFLPYQSTYYLALYFGTKEKAFDHGQVRLLAWSYGAIYLLAILLAIPYWRWLGLVP